MTVSLRAIGFYAAIFMALLPAGWAQDYPNRPITVVAPFPPGASTDGVARLTRDPLSEALGQPIVIENRPGAGGTTGSATVANARPDGYTLLITVNAPLTMNMYCRRTFPMTPRPRLRRSR